MVKQRKRWSPREQAKLLDQLVAQQGNVTAACATLDVDASTLWRWRTAESRLQGIALVAVRAVLAHPEDYEKYKELVRPAHRPKGPE